MIVVRRRRDEPYALAMRAFGEDGWDDQVMDDYNALDPAVHESQPTRDRAAISSQKRNRAPGDSKPCHIEKPAARAILQ
jgi:hypothetical protein